MTPPPVPADRYLGAVQLDTELGDAPFKVWVHLGIIGGRAVCAGVSVSGLDVDTPIPGWQPLTARRLRQLRLDELVEQAMAERSALIEEALDYPGANWEDDDVIRSVREELAALEGPVGPRRPGRPPTVSDEALVEVVARTYIQHVERGGRAPVAAVREALELTGAVEGSGTDRSVVTMNQARAAVRRARSKGLLGKTDKP